MSLLYSQHLSRFEANDALDRYYASGVVCESERPYITRIGPRWCVMFPDPSSELPKASR
jgi:hypothetical protein